MGVKTAKTEKAAKKEQTVTRYAYVRTADGIFPTLQFVLRARLLASGELRKPIQGLRAETDPELGRIVLCTDGRRIHIGPAPENLPDGNYAVLSESPKAVVIETSDVPDFPAWRKVEPKKKVDVPVSISLWCAQSKNPDHDRLTTALTRIIRAVGSPINLAYLIDLRGDDWRLTATDERPMTPHSIRLESDSGRKRIAIIAGMEPDL